MKYSQSEKMEIIRIVEQSALSISMALKAIGASRTSFYAWYHRKKYPEKPYREEAWFLTDKRGKRGEDICIVFNAF